MFSPARTPREIVAKLNADVRAALEDPEIRRQLEARGLEAFPGTPQALAKHMAGEIERWGKVIRDAGVKLGS